MSGQPNPRSGFLEGFVPGIAGNNTGAQLDTSHVTAPILFDAYGGYQLVDSANPYRLRFAIPPQVTVIRKVRVSFSLTSGVYVSQGGTIAGSNTSTDSVNHSHGVPGLGTPNHQHPWATTPGTATAAGGATGPVFSASDGVGVLGVIPGGPLVAQTLKTDTSGAGTTGAGTSSGFSVAHVHAFAGGTVAFGAPTALGAAGGASAAHIMLVGTGEMFPLPPSQQPPYGGGGAADFGPFDLTKYFAATGITYEIQFTTATIGGIIAQVQMVAQLTAS